MQMNDVMLPEINGDRITFLSIYKNEFNNWNLKDEIVLTPEQIDSIPLVSITKFKVYSEQPIENHLLVKIQETKQDSQTVMHLYAVGMENHRFFFEKFLLYKFKWMDFEFESSEHFTGSLEDDILKKSEFLGNWEERHVKITSEEGLTSKKLDKEKESLHMKQTKQIWTRFEVLQNTRFVVFKCKYMLGKIQLGIPTNKCGQWIKALYTLFASQ